MQLLFKALLRTESYFCSSCSDWLKMADDTFLPLERGRLWGGSRTHWRDSFSWQVLRISQMQRTYAELCFPQPSSTAKPNLYKIIAYDPRLIWFPGVLWTTHRSSSNLEAEQDNCRQNKMPWPQWLEKANLGIWLKDKDSLNMRLKMENLQWNTTNHKLLIYFADLLRCGLIC